MTPYTIDGGGIMFLQILCDAMSLYLVFGFRRNLPQTLII